MTNHEPIEINGTTFEPVPVACPACDAEIDAQRVLASDAAACPACGQDAAVLLHEDDPDPPASYDAGPSEDYEPESYTMEAQLDA